jgi:hypothetical protein
LIVERYGEGFGLVQAAGDPREFSQQLKAASQG